ncbi:MAG: division/cell wall cluster transcriptional repressor MraZ [Clostridia bacterium]|nr:division/cell wall cluster transcriptional repressor MraZ [Clostridia bacterium]
MLMGKYPHTLDSKNRLIIPSRLKDQLGPVVVIMQDSGGCLSMYSKEEFEEYASELSSKHKHEVKDIVRYIYSKSIEIQPDAQGRVLIPQEMLEHAGITKNVLTVGCGKYAEIWAEERWIEKDLDSEPEDFAARMAELGL